MKKHLINSALSSKNKLGMNENKEQFKNVSDLSKVVNSSTLVAKAKTINNLKNYANIVKARDNIKNIINPNLFIYLKNILNLRSHNFNWSDKLVSSFGFISLFDWKIINRIKLDKIIKQLGMNLNIVIGKITYSSNFKNLIININYFKPSESFIFGNNIPSYKNSKSPVSASLKKIKSIINKKIISSNIVNRKINLLFIELANKLSLLFNKVVIINMNSVKSPLADPSLFSWGLNYQTNIKRTNRIVRLLNRLLSHRISTANERIVRKDEFIKGDITGALINFNGRNNYQKLSNRKLKSLFLVGKLNNAKVLFRRSANYTNLNTNGLYTVKVTYSYNKRI